MLGTYIFIASNPLDNASATIKVRASNQENAERMAIWHAVAANGLNMVGLQVTLIPQGSIDIAKYSNELLDNRGGIEYTMNIG